MAKMLIYLTFMACIFFISIQSQILKSSFVYYTPAATQYISERYYPLLQTPQISAQYGKAVKSVQSENGIIFFLNPEITEQLILNTQPENLPVARYIAPATSTSDVKWSWLLKSNLPILSMPKNEAISENNGSINEQEKIETNKRSSEVETLAESEISSTTEYLMNPITPTLKPEQTLYIYSQQPQFFENYQLEIPKTQPTILQQLLTKSANPPTQNMFYLQTQDIGQPILKYGNPKSANQRTSGQSAVYFQQDLKDQTSISKNQPDIKPIRYQSQNLKPQNYLFLQDNQQTEKPIRYGGVTTKEQTVSKYPQLFFSRLVPGTSEIKSQALHQGLLQQQISHQTHYIPVEVVPPQLPVHVAHNPYETQHEFETQKLSFIHIPIDKNVVPPQYVKSVIPTEMNTKEIPVIPPQIDQKKKLDKQILYLSASVQPTTNNNNAYMNSAEVESQKQQNVIQNQMQIGEGMPGAAALEFVRYITSRQSNLHDDTIVINARTQEDKETTNSTDENNMDMTEEPSMARAQPAGIALVGPGGVASTNPRGTAVVGSQGVAIANPQATAVAGPDSLKPAKKSTTSS